MKKKKSFSTTHIIMISFLLVIFVGSILLYLPISAADHQPVSYMDALFTATTATCVTGLVTLPVATTWSLFGHCVILALMQIGGLGVVTILSGLMITMHRRIRMKDRLLLQDAFNLNSLSGLVRFTKKVLLGTLLVESVGALCYMCVFVPRYGLRGVFASIFQSVSAFCNAGMDVLSPNSLCAYANDPFVLGVTSALIILSGIGYVVWWDFLRVLQYFPSHGVKCFQKLTLHAKIALMTTIILLAFGTVCILLFEFDNPDTFGNVSIAQKLMGAFFQSVTTRTAGFAAVPQENLTNASAMVCILLMFVGGSPVGTAGGIKTVTFMVLIMSMISTLQNRQEVVLFDRNIPQHTVKKAVAVTGMSFAILFLSTVLLSAVTQADALDILYETVSATATVGLTRNLTPSLNDWGKVIIIVTMYLGRVSPISLAVAFTTTKTNPNQIKNPTEEISVG